MELCLEGRQILPFKLLVRVSSLRLVGEMRASLPPDIAYALISFVTMPQLEMTIDSEVSLRRGPRLD